MNTLKRYFGMAWLMAVFMASVHSAVMLVISGHPMTWLGAVVALWPVLLFFVLLMRSGKGRAPVTMKWPLFGAVLGTAIVLINYQALPMAYTLILGVTGILLYDYWYSVLPKQQNKQLIEGASLPEFLVRDANGVEVSSRQWSGKPLLLMFIRGNWCPLCVAQVNELATSYQQLAKKGVRIVIVSAQPPVDTQQLANRFSVPFEFYSDLGGKSAAKIGIQHEQGSPLGLVRYSADTVIPTVVICDAEGTIAYLDVAENYRDRPEPGVLFKQLGI